jgi:hypothetical protein
MDGGDDMLDVKREITGMVWEVTILATLSRPMSD